MNIEEIENRFTIDNLLKIENRFKEVTGLTHLDLSVPHFEQGENQCQKTTKEEQKQFSWITTPIWMVDKMIEPHMSEITLNSTTCDACAGCGQFTIRLLRKLYTKYPNMDIEKWLEDKHWFTELQESNVQKLKYIFGQNINVYVGDTRNLKYSTDSDKGILHFDEHQKKWL